MNAERLLPAARSRVQGVLAFARSAEPRKEPAKRAMIIDGVIAVLVLAGSLLDAQFSYGAPGGAIGIPVRPALVPAGSIPLHPGPVLGPSIPVQVAIVLAAVLTSVPLAARRRFPLAAYVMVLVGGLVLRRYTTDVAFFAVLFAGYSAIAHSRFRGAVLLIVPPAWMMAMAVLWLTPAPALGAIRGPTHPHWVLVAIVVLASMGMIMAIGYAVHIGDTQARLKAEHEAATRRALELERARIASELHDVVTHSVSIMIVQAGAARQVLAEAPDDARAALLAVEASGRSAMAELRHLLGLLSPAPAAPAGPDAVQPGAPDGQGGGPDLGPELEPQPGLRQVPALAGRLRAAGLPVELYLDPGLPAELSPGVDLTAYRVVQEALTNVIKHAGKPRTSVRLTACDGDLVVEVADAGRPIPAAAPPVPAGAGRGLTGLRERLAWYGGELRAGPGPDGGWLVRARLPAGLAAGAGLVPAAGRR